MKALNSTRKIQRTTRGYELTVYIGLPSSPVFKSYEEALRRLERLKDDEDVQADELRHGA